MDFQRASSEEILKEIKDVCILHASQLSTLKDFYSLINIDKLVDNSA